MLNCVSVKIPVRTFHSTWTRHICALEIVLPTLTAHCVACNGSFIHTLSAVVRPKVQMGVWLEQAASPSCCHPCNVGLEMLGFGLSQDFYTNATRLAHFVIWWTAALVGCSCLSTYRFLLQIKNLTSPSNLSAVSMACTTGRRSALALCTYHLGWCRFFPG